MVLVQIRQRMLHTVSIRRQSLSVGRRCPAPRWGNCHMFELNLNACRRICRTQSRLGTNRLPLALVDDDHDGKRTEWEDVRASSLTIIHESIHARSLESVWSFKLHSHPGMTQFGYCFRNDSPVFMEPFANLSDHMANQVNKALIKPKDFLTLNHCFLPLC
jgi:hypothetical protein